MLVHWLKKFLEDKNDNATVEFFDSKKDEWLELEAGNFRTAHYEQGE